MLRKWCQMNRKVLFWLESILTMSVACALFSRFLFAFIEYLLAHHGRCSETWRNPGNRKIGANFLIRSDCIQFFCSSLFHIFLSRSPFISYSVVFAFDKMLKVMMLKRFQCSARNRLVWCIKGISTQSICQRMTEGACNLLHLPDCLKCECASNDDFPTPTFVSVFVV